MAATYQKVVDDTINTDQTEVATQLLALQTQMQASYQATSILYKMSLTNYL
jgi:flagellin-like hook-associated protein FlgL